MYVPAIKPVNSEYPWVFVVWVSSYVGVIWNSSLDSSKTTCNCTFSKACDSLPETYTSNEYLGTSKIVNCWVCLTSSEVKQFVPIGLVINVTS